MSVSGVAFVPSAPLLIPAIAGGSASLDEVMRSASLAAVAEVIAAAPDVVLVVAAGASGGSWSADATWDFAGFGVARSAVDLHPRLPWSLGIGAWLLDECGWAGSRRYGVVGPAAVGPVGVGPDGDGGALADVASSEARIAIVAVGDGSACRTERAPGYLDDRAEAFDGAIDQALSSGDGTVLAGLDEELAGSVLCGSIPVWRAVAAQVDTLPTAIAQLTYSAAPYGVGYFVATWTF